MSEETYQISQEEKEKLLSSLRTSDVWKKILAPKLLDEINFRKKLVFDRKVGTDAITDNPLRYGVCDMHSLGHARGGYEVARKMFDFVEHPKKQKEG
jgi:hypothetical protein